MLLNFPPGKFDREHYIRFAIGAGADPQRHAEFEERFGFPLLEGWGMTEMVRLVLDCIEPRQVGTRSFGRIRSALQARIVDDSDVDLPDGSSGELLVRHSEAAPRKDFFSGYLNDLAATELAWKGGWFHTGDIVKRDADGVLHFVERRKNIIRRSGENIAAAEVEGHLQTHKWVLQAAVIAVKDELRDEEVLACVVLRPDAPKDYQRIAQELFDHSNAGLAYYKAPGWMLFVDCIPTTGTQKVQKHQIFPPEVDPRLIDGVFDLRAGKKRQTIHK